MMLHDPPAIVLPSVEFCLMQHTGGATIASVVESLPPKQIQVLRSAYKIMGEKGLNQLNLQDVTDEAGVGKATLLYYFSSKENLILLTMQWVLGRVAQRIREGIVQETSANTQILSMIDAIFVSADANWSFYLEAVS